MRKDEIFYPHLFNSHEQVTVDISVAKDKSQYLLEWGWELFLDSCSPPHTKSEILQIPSKVNLHQKLKAALLNEPFL